MILIIKINTLKHGQFLVSLTISIGKIPVNSTIYVNLHEFKIILALPDFTDILINVSALAQHT